MKTIFFDTSQPIFNKKFKNELSKRLTWAKSELVQFFPLLTPFYWLSMKTIYFDISQPYSKWNFYNELPNRLNRALMSWKWAGNIFSSFWPHFIHSAVKLSILMCHTISWGGREGLLVSPPLAVLQQLGLVQTIILSNLWKFTAEKRWR